MFCLLFASVSRGAIQDELQYMQMHRHPWLCNTNSLRHIRYTYLVSKGVHSTGAQYKPYQAQTHFIQAGTSTVYTPACVAGAVWTQNEVHHT
jgi:hypothetical protein